MAKKEKLAEPIPVRLEKKQEEFFKKNTIYNRASYIRKALNEKIEREQK